jgi:SAM-dependent methyltransferase
MNTPAENLSKVCNIEDFGRTDVREAIREIFSHDVLRFGPDFPKGREFRKHWEVAMAILALRSGGVLRPDAEVLGVGAGNEPTLFWLTRYVRRVFATDLYLASGAWGESANSSMLIDPSSHWPGPWNPKRLVVQHMNALDLRFEDNSFDGIFSSSSIEHFGTADDVRRSMREMYRVLKPGGRLSLSTEFRIDGPPPGIPSVLLFDRRELEDVLIGNLGWTLSSPLDTEVSAATRATETPFSVVLKDFRKHRRKHPTIALHEFEWSQYPNVVLREKERAWTSVHFALDKPVN